LELSNRCLHINCSLDGLEEVGSAPRLGRPEDSSSDTRLLPPPLSPPRESLHPVFPRPFAALHFRASSAHFANFLNSEFNCFNYGEILKGSPFSFCPCAWVRQATTPHLSFHYRVEWLCVHLQTTKLRLSEKHKYYRGLYNTSRTIRRWLARPI
jgi:hypothetical protein